MLEWITAERVDLYSYVSSPGEKTPVTIKLGEVDESVPTEEDIEEAVKKMRRNRSAVREDEIQEAVEQLQRKRSGGPSGMRAEHLKGWLAASKRREREAEEEGEGKTDNKEGEGGPTEPNWERLVDLIQTAFREGRLA